MKRPIGILAAMEVEVNAILAYCDTYQQQNIGSIPIYEATIAGHDLVIGLCGIGKVAAGARTMLMIQHYDPQVIINIGTAGGLRSDQHVLDVVLANTICQYDLDVYDWGFGYGNRHTCFTIDPTWLNLAQKVIVSDDHKVWVGAIATGDVFVHTVQHVETILSRYPESLCAEMEGGAIAQVANMMDVPVLVIRSLSDITVVDGNEMTYEAYVTQASKRAAVWCKALVERSDQITQ